MRCCIGECKSSFKNGIRSHCIPSLAGIRQKWLEAVKIINAGPNDRICSKHFATTDYQDNGTERPALLSDAIPSQNLPTLETNRGFDQNVSNHKKQTVNYDLTLDGYQLNFDDDIGEDERRFYLKLFPLVNLVREKKTHCTSCNAHLGTAPASEDNIKMHPILRVSQCKKCHDFYNSGEFSKGEDGSELYCRWCGQGGEVYCCAKCPYVFCKACIGGNLAKSLVADIRDNENWSCFVCSPKITWPIRAVHWALKNYIAKQKQSILLLNTNENEKHRLMKKDTSICCGKLNDEDSSNDSDPPLKKTNIMAPSITKKRKRSNEEILGQPKPKILNSILTANNSSGSGSGNSPSTSLQKTNFTVSKNHPLMLNSGVVIQKHPSSAGTSNSGTTILRPVQNNQTQVKIVQLTNQQNKTVSVPLTTQHGTTIQTIPPPLVIRNRGVQIRQHPILQNRSISSIRSTTTTSTSTTTNNNNNNNNSDHTPVYHTIGGFCIDLNSAAQHDSIRLPNGKLIQVKKSSNNTNQTTTLNQRNQISAGGVLNQPIQPQQHFTITQPLHQQQINSAGSIQTIPASAIIPNATGSLQILNGNVIQQIQNQQLQQQQQQNQVIRSNGPMLIRSIFPNTAVGKARNQLQNQIFTAMEICQHLSGKIQTLTNSNPYKNASSHIDVKELYIHLSYLFTYAIGRFKNLQDKCNEDMTNMGFNTEVSKLTKGQLAAEKYASDGDEDEIEIVEPKTTTIDLDSDDDDSLHTNKKTIDGKIPNILNINTITLKDLQRHQAAKQQQMLRDTQHQQTLNSQQFQGQQNLSQTEENDYDLPLTLLAGMLEVELTEGNDSLNSTSSGSTLPKKPRKKTTNKPNPHLIKQQQEQLRAKYNEIKRCDVKLKQECSIVIDALDLDVDDVKEAFQRYSEQQNDDDIDNEYDVMGLNTSDELNDSANVDAVMQLLEVTMDGGEEINASTNDINNENLKSDEGLDKNLSDNENKNQSAEEIDKETKNEEKVETDHSAEEIGNAKNINEDKMETDDHQNKINDIEMTENIENELETDENIKEEIQNIENKEDAKNAENCENNTDNHKETDSKNDSGVNKETYKENTPELNPSNELSLLENDKSENKNLINDVYESNDSNDRPLQNTENILKEDKKSDDDAISDVSICKPDNINIVENNNSPEDDLCEDNNSKTPANIASTDTTNNSELNSNIEKENNINTTAVENPTVEPLEADTNLLNIPNPSELIDKLLADAVKMKSSGDDDCPNDFIDHPLSESLLTDE